MYYTNTFSTDKCSRYIQLEHAKKDVMALNDVTLLTTGFGPNQTSAGIISLLFTFYLSVSLCLSLSTLSTLTTLSLFVYLPVFFSSPLLSAPEIWYSSYS